MPVVVVALAAGSMAAGVTAFAAATTLAGMVVAGAAVVGGALTIAGTITGNAKLAKIGGILSLVGGIGSLAMNLANGGAAAGAAADAASTTGGAVADVAADAAVAGGEAAAAAASDIGAQAAAELGTQAAGQVGAQAVGDLASAASSSGGGLLDAALSGGAGGSAANVSGGLLDAALTAPAAAPANALSGTGNMATQAGSAAFDMGSTTVGQAAKISANADMSAYIPGGLENIPAGETSLWSRAVTAGKDMQAWAKANPMLAKAALEGGSAVLKGMNPSEAEKAQMEAYRQMAEDKKRRALWGSGRIS